MLIQYSRMHFHLLLMFMLTIHVVSGSSPPLWSDVTESQCVAEPCLNGGVCSTDEDGNAICDCSNTDYLGDKCEVENACLLEPCLHGGLCSLDEAFIATCNCSQTDYIGSKCEIKIPCLPNPCLNNGECFYDAIHLNFSCDCQQTGYTGSKCEIDDPCFMNPCLNGGTCLGDVHENFVCSCAYGYAGNWCQLESIGCYSDSLVGRNMSINPGFFKFDDCQQYCQENGWYTGLRDMEVCLCGEDLPQTNVEDRLCNTTCLGTSMECNNYFYYLMFGKGHIIYNLAIDFVGEGHNISDASAISGNTVYTIGVNFTNTTYFMNYDVNTGDGFNWKRSKDSPVKHAFPYPGNYIVSVTARGVSGRTYPLIQKIKVLYAVEISSPLECDMPVGMDITCRFELSTGSDVVAKINFHDGDYATFDIDCPTATYGSSANTPDFELSWEYPQARYIKYNEIIKEKGRLVGWELYILSPGNVMLEVYRPPINNIANLTESIGSTVKKTCGKSYNFYKRKCTTGKNTFADDVYFPSAPNVTLHVVHADIYYFNKSGKHYFRLDRPFKVAEGDIIGWHYIKSGVIAQTPGLAGPEFVRPTPLDESEYISEIHPDTIVSTTNNSHMIRAVIVRPSVVAVEHRCKYINLDNTSYYCAVEINLLNDVSSARMFEYLRIAPPVRNVTINGTNVARTLEVFSLSVLDHPGMELRYCSRDCINSTYDNMTIVEECVLDPWDICIITSVEDQVFYDWDFKNDNETVTRNKEAHSWYSFTGTYNITLRAYNNNTEASTSFMFEVQEDIANITFQQATPQPKFNTYPIAVTNISQAAHAKWTLNGTKPIINIAIGTEDRFNFTVNPGETVSFDKISADGRNYSNVIASNKGLCRNPLGLQSSITVNDSQFEASSTLMSTNATFYPYLARLHNPIGAWLPNSTERDQWIQVDLKTLFVVTGIVTQGVDSVISGWIDNFTISYSLDGCSWIFESDNHKQYIANWDGHTPVTNIFDNPLIARFIRVIVVEQFRQVALRFELLGCKSGEICLHQLGIENGEIADEQITISTESDVMFKPSFARLTKTDKENPGGWCPNITDVVNNWIEVDFRRFTTVTGVIIQGSYRNASHGLSKFYLGYSQDAISWTNTTKIFSEENLSKSQKRLMLEEAIFTRFIRLHVVTLSQLCVRFDFLGCKDSRLCHEPLGLESGAVPDSKITASSFYPGFPTLYARPNNGYDWRAYSTKEQWLMVEFSKKVVVTGVITIIEQVNSYYVSKFKVAFSSDIRSWTFMKDQNGDDKIFDGNVDRIRQVKTIFEYAVVAKSARIYPTESSPFPALTIEWLGCYESGDIYLTSSDATDVQINIEYFNLLNSVLVSANASFVEEISDFEIEPQQYIGYGYDGVIQGTLSSGSHLKFEVKMDGVNLTSYLNEDYLLTQTLAITFTPNWTSLEGLKNFSVIVTIDNVISYPVSLSLIHI
ncbi:uncharacterized protein LOC117103649 [Anneissia japonica]|uniref:uncharacterized protein LOC117103649 n=1 Tax=Anneissia japonica TaxID=1529436 RepID=UPI0014258E40|nr:uncharacterized protein LOC117103649 [Anneissia japonica]